MGYTAESLTRAAEEDHVNLVATCATHRGAFASAYLGSVSRALAIGSPTSVLTAKSGFKTKDELTVVIATDHSNFGWAALSQFQHLAPAGIKELHVISAYDISDNDAATLNKTLPMLGGDVDKWLSDTVHAANDRFIKKLQEAGYKATGHIMKGRTNDVIKDFMEKVNADLLVVGSQGHGFFERVRIGSTSVHQVVNEAYPVLVLRP